jgi:hypothetical protein
MASPVERSIRPTVAVRSRPAWMVAATALIDHQQLDSCGAAPADSLAVNQRATARLV